MSWISTQAYSVAELLDFTVVQSIKAVYTKVSLTRPSEILVPTRKL